jgi:hypothetical protein
MRSFKTAKNNALYVAGTHLSSKIKEFQLNSGAVGGIL